MITNSYAEGRRVEFDQSDAPTRMGTIVRVDTVSEDYFNVVIKIDGCERLTNVCTAYGKHVRVVEATTPTGATVRELAAFADTEIHELRAFADDMLDGLGDDDAMTGETERTLREALAQQAALDAGPRADLVVTFVVNDYLTAALAPARAAVKRAMFDAIYSLLPVADAETLAYDEREQRERDGYDARYDAFRDARRAGLTSSAAYALATTSPDEFVRVEADRQISMIDRLGSTAAGFGANMMAVIRQDQS